MDDLNEIEWQQPEPEETHVIRLAIEGAKFVQNLRDEQRSRYANPE